ncbi:MAG: hypothetical protein IIB88_01760, partial [Chloroflexi bacterium]|nr:hypothetical protein [Chloroflexota bacterium]
GQRLLIESGGERFEVVANEEGLTSLGEIVELIGGIALAGRAAFEVRDEGWAFLGEVL